MTQGNEVWDLSDDQCLELGLALLARVNREEDGAAALRRTYPAAPDAMIDTAAFHVYVGGPPAVIAFLADAELAIRNPGHELDYGVTWNVLHHLYNWLQFWALLPDAKDTLLSIVNDLEESVKQGDHEELLKSLEELREVVKGFRGLPEIG